MKSFVTAITAFLAALVISATAPAFAGTGQTSLATPNETLASTCDSGYFCVWTGQDYKGTKNGLNAGGPNGTCIQFRVGGAAPYRSYKNRTNNEGYFYSTRNCTGASRAVRSGSQGNIGFPAWSFRVACVSC